MIGTFQVPVVTPAKASSILIGLQGVMRQLQEAEFVTGVFDAKKLLDFMLNR